MAIIDTEILHQLIINPSETNSEMVAALETTAEAFPYFQISHALLAKATAGTAQLDETRPKAAVYALSRVALQHLIEFEPETSAGPVEDVSEAESSAAPQNGEDILISDVEQQLASAAIAKSEEQKRQQAIIQGFIKKNPRINRQDNNLEPFELDLTGRVAESWEGNIETEAFAKILIRQGKIEKAIDVYQKLILKKPEKRNYFAKKLSELYHQ